MTGAVRALAAAHPQLTVEVLRTSWADQTEVVRVGRADVSYVRLPVDQSGLKVNVLFDEFAGFAAAHLPSARPAASAPTVPA